MTKILTTCFTFSSSVDYGALPCYSLFSTLSLLQPHAPGTLTSVELLKSSKKEVRMKIQYAEVLSMPLDTISVLWLWVPSFLHLFGLFSYYSRLLLRWLKKTKLRRMQLSNSQSNAAGAAWSALKNASSSLLNKFISESHSLVNHFALL